MQNITKSSFFVALLFISSLSFGQGSDKFSISTQATANSAGTEITLKFTPVSDVNSYSIFRKDFGAESWGNAIATLGADDSTYTDNTIEAGKMYDYHLVKTGDGGLTGYGYVTAGAKVEAIHDRGKVLLVVDSALGSQIPAELSMLKKDLVGDGYQVLEYSVAQTVDHIAIKTKIEDFKKQHATLEHVYILGHVAVPYSGIYCEDTYWVVPPDGHKAGVGDHCGAWAADAYYGVFTGSWSDVYSVTTGTRSHTKNEPSDGKFDQIVLPGKVELNIGRVDLSNLPAFSKNEVELTQQYITKSHNYRHGITKPVMKALVDENFAANGGEQFGASGYRSFGAMVGIDNINQNDYMTTTKDEQYLVAHGTGPGSYTSCGGVGKTSDFVTNNSAAYFNMLFGSFFGNWDIDNNFLRAPLAVEKGGLTNAWAGRPNWHFYPLALNQTTGYCARLTQNNTTLYDARNFRNQIHVALMGDPTLHLNIIAPATDVKVAKQDGDKTALISWTASIDNVDGYYVYYSKDSMGPFVKATAQPITNTSFAHTAPHQGTVYYMVRSTRLENTNSGSFYNLGQGSFGMVEDLINTSIDPLLSNVSDIQVYPNPASSYVRISFKSDTYHKANLEVIDASGRAVLKQVVNSYDSESLRIDVSNLTAGLYFVKINNASSRLMIQ